jgi:glycerol uptake facilitator
VNSFSNLVCGQKKKKTWSKSQKIEKFNHKKKQKNMSINSDLVTFRHDEIDVESGGQRQSRLTSGELQCKARDRRKKCVINEDENDADGTFEAQCDFGNDEDETSDVEVALLSAPNGAPLARKQVTLRRRRAAAKECHERQNEPMSDEEEQEFWPRWLRAMTSALYATFSGSSPLLRVVFSEFVGTFVLVFGCIGVVSSGMFASAVVGVWQTAAITGASITLAILVASMLGGPGHLNPAVTVAMAVFRSGRVPWHHAITIVGAQLLGGLMAGGLNLALWAGSMSHFEHVQGIERGAAGSELAAMAFGCYFPNPSLAALAKSAVGVGTAFGAEFFGTAVLLFIVFAVTDRRQPPHIQHAAPFIIGLTIAVLLGFFAPLSMACFNPARDLGPRLVTLAAGFGKVAFPGPRSGFWIYIVAPITGALFGSFVFHFLRAIQRRK